MILNFASNPLIPVVKKCHSNRKNARNEKPLGLRYARSERTWHRSTPQFCFRSR